MTKKTVLKPQEKRKLGNAGGYAPHADKTARVRAREGVPDATAWGDCENNRTQTAIGLLFRLDNSITSGICGGTR